MSDGDVHPVMEAINDFQQERDFLFSGLAVLVITQMHGVPLKRWFRNELRDWVHDCLVESSSTAMYFRREEVERTLGEHESGRRNHASKIYSLLVFELWHRHYMPGRP